MISICYTQLCLDTQTAKEEGQGEAPPAGSVRKHLSLPQPIPSLCLFPLNPDDATYTQVDYEIMQYDQF